MASEKNSTSADEKRLANWNTSSVAFTNFQGRRLPEPGYLAGYAALIEQYCLPVLQCWQQSATGTPRVPLTLGKF